jgi:serine/threonine-protein kinase HipA
VETGTGLKLNITGDDNALDLNLALEVCPYFRLKKERAIEIIEEVKTSVRNWRIIARKYGLSKLDCDLKASAFSKAE